MGPGRGYRSAGGYGDGRNRNAATTGTPVMAADQRILYEIKPFCLVILGIFLAAETKRGIQNLFTDTEAGWCNLQKLIGINEFQSLLQTQFLWRYKL